MSTTSPAMKALEQAGKKLARLQKQRDDALEEVKAAIRAADAEGGHSRQDLWRASKVARQTVYDALKETPVADPLTGASLPTAAPTEADAAAEQRALDVSVGSAP